WGGGRAEAWGEQRARDAVHRRLGLDLQDEGGEPVAGRREDTLAERLVALAEGGTDLSVVGGPFHRDVALAGRRGGRLTDEIRGGGEEEDGEDDENHGLPLEGDDFFEDQRAER